MPSTSSQNRAALINQLDNIGSSKGAFTVIDIYKAGEEAVFEFIERVKANINSANMIVTGAIDNISTQVDATGIKIKGSKHLLYQDKGVKGAINSDKAPRSPYKYSTKMPPLQAFIDYIKRKNINLRNEAQFFEKGSDFEDLTEEQQIKQVAYLMQRAVWRNGFRPRNIVSKELPQLKKDLHASILGFAKQQIRAELNGKNVRTGR